MAEVDAQQASGLNTDTFLIREHVGLMKLHEEYDILSKDGQPLGKAMETTGGFVKFLKLLMNKNALPFTVDINDAGGARLVQIHRGFTLFRSKVVATTGAGKDIGYFKQRFFSLGGAFDIYDMADTQIAALEGDWKGWNFKFKDKNGQEVGVVSRQWGGVLKELFTNADNYVVHIDRTKITDPDQLLLLLSAGICIDMVLKEEGN